MKEKTLKQLALAITLNCVRNTSIENIHSGISVQSSTEDESDIFVVTKNGNIPWRNVSRISQEEMKIFITEVADKIYTFLMNQHNLDFLEGFEGYSQRFTIGWNEPQYLENWFKKK
ncbi:MAG: hypothetical protein ABI855_09675 [Bacteroidota bacterium]